MPTSASRSVVSGLLAAALGAVGVVAVYVLAVVDPAGRALDEAVLSWAAALGSPVQSEVLAGLGLVGTTSVLVAVAGLAGVALVRGRPARAAVVVAVVLAAQAVTQTLKAVLPRAGTDGNSLPSGHVTVVASLVVAAVLVLPRALRPVVAVAGVGLVAVTGVLTMLADWHRPSDVLAAVLVVVAVTGVALAVEAVVSPAPPRRPAGSPGSGAPARPRTRVGPAPRPALRDRTTVPATTAPARP